jgi:choline monooxygenase
MQQHNSLGDQRGKDPVDYLASETYQKTRLPVSEATTLIPNAYHRDDFFTLETQQLWNRGWVCVGYECQVKEPGDVMVIELQGQSLLIVRDKSNEIRSFHNVCRHRGSKLVTEQTHCSVIRCPYHGWGYGLDGQLLGAPYFQGLDVPPQAAELFRIRAEEEGKFCKEDYGLLPVRVDSWGGLLFVNLSGDACPLSEWLGDLPDRYRRYPLNELQLVCRKDYSISANWKLIAENFMEYYHLPSVHPELCNISGFENHYRCQGPGMYTGMCTSPLTVDPQTVRLDLPVFPGLNPTEAESVYFIMLFPNVALWIFPNHMLTLLFRPESPTLTVESMDMLVHPSALEDPGNDESFRHIMEFWDMVNRQDIDIVERVQKGLSSGAYPGGRMCYAFEEPVHRFQNMVIDCMLGIHRIPPGDPQEDGAADRLN